MHLRRRGERRAAPTTRPSAVSTSPSCAPRCSPATAARTTRASPRTCASVTSTCTTAPWPTRAPSRWAPATCGAWPCSTRGLPVRACIHRAPPQGPGAPRRLLLISSAAGERGRALQAQHEVVREQQGGPADAVHADPQLGDPLPARHTVSHTERRDPARKCRTSRAWVCCGVAPKCHPTGLGGPRGPAVVRHFRARFLRAACDTGTKFRPDSLSACSARFGSRRRGHSGPRVHCAVEAHPHQENDRDPSLTMVCAARSALAPPRRCLGSASRRSPRPSPSSWGAARSYEHRRGSGRRRVRADRTARRLVGGRGPAPRRQLGLGDLRPDVVHVPRRQAGHGRLGHVVVRRAAELLRGRHGGLRRRGRRDGAGHDRLAGTVGPPA